MSLQKRNLRLPLLLLRWTLCYLLLRPHLQNRRLNPPQHISPLQNPSHLLNQHLTRSTLNHGIPIGMRIGVRKQMFSLQVIPSIRLLRFKMMWIGKRNQPRQMIRMNWQRYQVKLL